MKRKQAPVAVMEQEVDNNTNEETHTLEVTHSGMHRLQLQEISLDLRQSIGQIDVFNKKLKRLSDFVDTSIYFQSDIDCNLIVELDNLVGNITTEITDPICLMTEKVHDTMQEFKDICRQAMSR